jgi:cell division protein FtsW
MLEQKKTKSSNSYSLITFEPLILLLTIMLVFFSLVMIYSTTGVKTLGSGGDPFYYLKQQSVSVLTGLLLMVILAFMPVSVLKRFSPYAYPLGILILFLTIIPGIGSKAGGATRWLTIGSFRCQPGELTKVLTIIFFAGFFDRHAHRLERFRQGVVVPILLLIPIAFLYLLQPDFGSTVVVVTVILLMGIVAGIKISHFLICGLTAASVALPLILISPYRLKRIIAFLSPLSDPAGKGYQLVQSLIALGSGQTTGIGIGRSQQKLHYLPAAHTDFIFSVIGEELGFIGCLSVIAIFSLILWRCLRIAMMSSDDIFLSTLAAGLGLLIVLPALLNIGVVTGLLPTKGMVLPLVGYGGSSMLVSLGAIGLVLAIFRANQLRGVARL